MASSSKWPAAANTREMAKQSELSFGGPVFVQILMDDTLL
jgi:hypothetical protein